VHVHSDRSNTTGVLNYVTWAKRQYNQVYYGMFLLHHTARMDSFSQEILHFWWSLDHPNLVDTHHHSSVSLPDCDMFSARPSVYIASYHDYAMCVHVHGCAILHMHVCVHERERERERGGGGERAGE
jgi:hypothetical protein